MSDINQKDEFGFVPEEQPQDDFGFVAESSSVSSVPTASQEEEKGFLDKALEGYEKYGAAPMRAGMQAIQKSALEKGSPLDAVAGVKAAYDQFGEDPSKAPSVQQLVDENPLGRALKSEPVKQFTEQAFKSSPALMPLNAVLDKETVRELPGQAAEMAASMSTDPLSYVPGAAIAKPLGVAGKALKSAGTALADTAVARKAADLGKSAGKTFLKTALGTDPAKLKQYIQNRAAVKDAKSLETLRTEILTAVTENEGALAKAENNVSKLRYDLANAKDDVKESIATMLASAEDEVAALRGQLDNLKNSEQQIVSTLTGEADAMASAARAAEARALNERQLAEQQASSTLESTKTAAEGVEGELSQLRQKQKEALNQAELEYGDIRNSTKEVVQNEKAAGLDELEATKDALNAQAKPTEFAERVSNMFKGLREKASQQYQKSWQLLEKPVTVDQMIEALARLEEKLKVNGVLKFTEEGGAAEINALLDDLANLQRQGVTELKGELLSNYMQALGRRTNWEPTQLGQRRSADAVIKAYRSSVKQLAKDVGNTAWAEFHEKNIRPIYEILGKAEDFFGNYDDAYRSLKNIGSKSSVQQRDILKQLSEAAGEGGLIPLDDAVAAQEALTSKAAQRELRSNLAKASPEAQAELEMLSDPGFKEFTIQDLAAQNPEAAAAAKQIQEKEAKLAELYERLKQSKKGDQSVLEADKALAEAKAEAQYLDKGGKQAIVEDLAAQSDELTQLRQQIAEKEAALQNAQIELNTIKDPSNRQALTQQYVEDLAEYQRLQEVEKDLSVRQARAPKASTINAQNAQTVIANAGRGTKLADVERLQQLDQVAGTTFTEDAKKTMLKEYFERPDIQGSRRTLLGKAVGAGVGALFGVATGGPIGGTVGAIAGAAADISGRKLALKGADMALGLRNALEKAPQKLGKYAPQLQAALQRGPQALAVTHYLLSQKDPNYRQTVESLDKEPVE